MNPPVRMNFLPLALVLKGKGTKTHANWWVQMWFAKSLVNQPEEADQIVGLEEALMPS